MTIRLSSTGTVVGTLTNPASLPTDNNQNARFTAPGDGVALKANTEYQVYIDVLSGGSNAGHYYMESGAEGSGRSHGLEPQ